MLYTICHYKRYILNPDSQIRIMRTDSKCFLTSRHPIPSGWPSSRRSLPATSQHCAANPCCQLVSQIERLMYPEVAEGFKSVCRRHIDWCHPEVVNNAVALVPYLSVNTLRMSLSHTLHCDPHAIATYGLLISDLVTVWYIWQTYRVYSMDKWVHYTLTVMLGSHRRTREQMLNTTNNIDTYRYTWHMVCARFPIFKLFN